MPGLTAIRGGSYPSEQDSEGFYTIHDVPIFGENEREFRTSAATKPTKVSYDRAWLEKAVEDARRRYAQDGYLAPAHIGHHGEGEGRPEKAGFFLPTRVGEMTVAGKRIAVVFADLLKIPKRIFDRIADYELPYRSVETPIDGTAEIHSLALLADQVPFFRFPMLTVNRPQRGRVTSVEGVSNLALAFSVGREHLAHLSRFPVNEPAKVEEPKTKTAGASIAAVQTNTTGAPPPATFAAPPAADEPKTKDEGGGEKPPSEKTEQPKEGDGVEAKIDRVLAILEKLAPNFGIATPAATGGPIASFSAPAATPTASAPVAPTPTAPAAPEASTSLARLEGENAALRTELARFQASETEKASVAKAIERLRGYPIPGLSEMCAAQFRAGGQKALDALCEGVEKAGTKEPDSSWTAGEGGAKDTVPPELAKYQAEGPAVLSTATEAAVLFEQLAPVHKRDRAGFIEFYVRRSHAAPSRAA